MHYAILSATLLYGMRKGHFQAKELKVRIRTIEFFKVVAFK